MAALCRPVNVVVVIAAAFLANCHGGIQTGSSKPLEHSLANRSSYIRSVRLYTTQTPLEIKQLTNVISPPYSIYYSWKNTAVHASPHI